MSVSFAKNKECKFDINVALQTHDSKINLQILFVKSIERECSYDVMDCVCDVILVLSVVLILA